MTDTDWLIAHWQPVGLKLTEMLKGDMDAGTWMFTGSVILSLVASRLAPVALSGMTVVESNITH